MYGQEAACVRASASPDFRKGAYGWKPSLTHRAQISQFELFEPILLLKFDKQLPVERAIRSYRNSVNRTMLSAHDDNHNTTDNDGNDSNTSNDINSDSNYTEKPPLAILSLRVDVNNIYIYIYIHTHTYIHICIYLFVYLFCMY